MDTQATKAPNREYLRTRDAADLLNCAASSLASYSHRLNHVCVRDGGQPYKARDLLWPSDVVGEASALRAAQPGLGVPAAFEKIVGKISMEEWLDHRPMVITQKMETE